MTQEMRYREIIGQAWTSKEMEKNANQYYIHGNDVAALFWMLKAIYHKGVDV